MPAACGPSKPRYARLHGYPLGDPRGARITGAVVATVLVALLLLLALVDWNALKGPLARLASADLHRSVRIEHLSVHLWQRTPQATVDGLTIANPDRAPGQMAQIGSITLAIEPWPLLRGRLVLARLQIDHPQLSLLRDADNRANWDFSSDQNKKKPPQKPGPPAQLPAVHQFTMNGGTLQVQDQIRKLTFDGSVNANENSSHSAQSFELRGHGELNGKGFDLSFGGSPLFNLQLDHPYDYDAQVHAGPLQVSAKGAIDKPFDLAHLSASVDFKERISRASTTSPAWHCPSRLLSTCPPICGATACCSHCTNCKARWATAISVARCVLTHRASARS